MNKLVISAIGSVALAAGAFAVVPNGYKVEQIWSGTTGTFGNSGTFPAVNMTMANQAPVSGGEQFGERYVAWLSADNGATKAGINGHKDFTLVWDMTMHTTFKVEAGLLLQYDNSRGFTPESQIYINQTPGNTAMQTSGDWVLPGYNASAAGATNPLGQTIRMSLEYKFLGVNSLQRISYGSFNSGWVNGNWGGPIYDSVMQMGFYFQPVISGATAPQHSEVEFNLVSFSETAVPEPGSLMVLGLGAVAMMRKRSKK